MPYLALALLSGIPALVYEVVWTRQVALVLGGQVEATSLVLGAFFAGLALGARWLGSAADRSPSPLRLYGALEAGAGVLASASLPALRALGSDAALRSLTLPVQLAACALVLLPAALLLGGALPALLRAAETDASRAPRTAGWLLAANTAGAVLGVALATGCVPLAGLAATQLGAVLGGVLLGGACIGIAARTGAGARARTQAAPRPRLPGAPLLAAACAGAATLGFEVLAARMAALQLGSSLFAWSAVLALLLVGLALGNALFAPRAARSLQPARDLGWIETAAAAAIAVGLLALLPSAAAPAQGLAPAPLLRVGFGVLPPAFLMGGAFPFFVRLAVRDPASLGRAFGSVSGANTAGGVAGSLAAPFLLLPGLGLLGGALACAAINAALGLVFLGAGPAPRRGLRVAAAAGVAGAAFWLAVAWEPRGHGEGRLLFVAHGRQASAAVVHIPGRRDLVVDGELEASTAGAARATEELLALLPLALHPEPRLLLEVGLGSGITLGSAARLPLERIECVEIAASVIEAAPYFAPDNREPTSGRDPRVKIWHADGRAFLAGHRGEYDVVIANTLHPWSLGATGLYSREYFARMAAALRPGGLGVQWLPLERIGAEHLAAILRTFFAVFPHGGLWWGEENVLAVGGDAPQSRVDPQRFAALPVEARALLARLGIESAADLDARRLAGASAVRHALGPGETLSDDRPRLEAGGLRRRSGATEGGELALVARIAETGAATGSGDGLLRLWLESRALRVAGEAERADRIEDTTAEAGLALARQARAGRVISEANAAWAAGRRHEAAQLLRRALALWPAAPDARHGLAILAYEQDDLTAALAELEQLVAAHRDHSRAWNLLGVVQRRRGDASAAARAFAQALELDPFLTQALANAGLVALERGDRAEAEQRLARLRTLAARDVLPEERALAAAIEDGRP